MNHSNSNKRPTAALLAALLASAGGLAICARSLAQSPADAAASAQGTVGQWVPTGSLHTPRSSGHTATRLLDGDVLVVGGQGAYTALRSTELYDPGSGTWRATGQLQRARLGHTATLLSNGKVLVVGGAGVPRPYGQGTAEIYDPATGLWTPAGTMVIERSGHTAVLLRDGRVLVAGGTNFEFASEQVRLEEIYDPASGQWSSTAKLKAQRSSHVAALLPDGKVMVAGGYFGDWSEESIDTTELYDPARGTWTTVGRGGFVNDGGRAMVLPTGEVLTVGYYVQKYSATSGNWIFVDDLPGTGGGNASTLLAGGEVLVTGGITGNFSPAGEFIGYLPGTTYLYDSNGNSGRVVAGPAVPRSSHTATLLSDGAVLVVGGTLVGGNEPLASAELYRSETVIDQRYTGTWYDPAQPGHGLFIEVLPEGRFLAWWFAFDPAGMQQAWFGGAGTYSGATATIPQVTQSSGGRWIPNFNPAQVVNNAWGSLSFEFSDLDHGRVDFSSIAGYGSGSMNLTRLTRPVPSEANPNPASAGAISPAFTGAWYDPAQPGHGLFLEVLPGDRMLAWWFSFDPSGTQQAWFGGVGAYYGDTVVISDVVQPTGGRWIPNFNPQQVTNIAWGTLTLTFSDCAHGTAQFSSTRGYGNGSMSLSRLTVPVGFSCP